jgi:hypothetical protein
MGYNVHDVVKKSCILLCKKTLKKVKSIFGYDLKLLSFLKMKHKIYKELTHFSKLHIYSKIQTNKISSI